MVICSLLIVGNKQVGNIGWQYAGAAISGGKTQVARGGKETDQGKRGERRGRKFFEKTDDSTVCL